MRSLFALFSYYSCSLLVLLKYDNLTKKEEIINENVCKKLNNNINYNKFVEVFHPHLIFNDKEQMLNISIPFNREIKKIYDLDFYYVDYENYDFNKLSDLFLNIHIFIN